MATFINQKEEVLEVKLTPKGKELFSKGQFKPFYYSFYDSEVIYDGEYAGIKEIQNSIVDRIKERARTKVVTNYGQVPALQDQNYEALLSSSAEYFRVLGTKKQISDFFVYKLENDAWELRDTFDYDLQNSLIFL